MNSRKANKMTLDNDEIFYTSLFNINGKQRTFSPRHDPT